MHRDSLALDARLYAISAMCPKCGVFADIGTDHGRLGAYLLQTGNCEKAIFTDVSAMSLKKAERLIAILGLSAVSEFRVGDGAMALETPPDTAVIAGMGGETISGIITRGRDILANARIVMQPNVDAPILRKTLMDNGFAITDERIVRDGRRLYVIIAAESGSVDYCEIELSVGPVLMNKRPDTLLDFANFRLRVARKALAGIKAGGHDAPDMQREIEIWEEVARWYA